MKGYYLPAFSVEEEEQEYRGVPIRVPCLTASEMVLLSDRLIAAQKRLAAESIFKIVDWIDAAARCWTDPNDSIRREAESLLPRITGDSPQMVRFALDDLFKQLTRPLLMQLLEAELGDPSLLDHFRPKPKGVGFTRAVGPRLTAHILPGNLPGTAILSLVCALLTKSSSLAKVSRKEFLLPVLFAESLLKIHPDLAKCLAILTWENGAIELTRAVLRKADCVILYGGGETIETLRKEIPATARTLFHGHRLSLGVIARELINKDAATRAATDVVPYDQRGCLSPHLYYVEAGGRSTPLEFAQWLAEALSTAAVQLPKGMTSPGEASRIQQLRGTIPLAGGRVFESPQGCDWTVLYDPDPAFSVSPLSRTVWVKPLPDLSEVIRFLEPIRSFLQAVGIAIPEARQGKIVTALASMGVSRICPIGEMQTPPLTWHHDGRFRLLDLLRFVDWENP